MRYKQTCRVVDVLETNVTLLQFTVMLAPPTRAHNRAIKRSSRGVVTTIADEKVKCHNAGV